MKRKELREKLLKTSRPRAAGVEGGRGIVELNSERLVVAHEAQLPDYLVATPRNAE